MSSSGKQKIIFLVLLILWLRFLIIMLDSHLGQILYSNSPTFSTYLFITARTHNSALVSEILVSLKKKSLLKQKCF